MDAGSTLEQLLAPYTNPESHNAQRHRQTDRQQDVANSRSYCVAVRSAKNQLSAIPRDRHSYNESVRSLNATTAAVSRNRHA